MEQGRSPELVVSMSRLDTQMSATDKDDRQYIVL